jgi:hypothetical protein
VVDLAEIVQHLQRQAERCREDLGRCAGPAERAGVDGVDRFMAEQFGGTTYLRVPL